jgi:hypothetical protein
VHTVRAQQQPCFRLQEGWPARYSVLWSSGSDAAPAPQLTQVQCTNVLVLRATVLAAFSAGLAVATTKLQPQQALAQLIQQISASVTGYFSGCRVGWLFSFDSSSRESASPSSPMAAKVSLSLQEKLTTCSAEYTVHSTQHHTITS